MPDPRASRRPASESTSETGSSSATGSGSSRRSTRTRSRATSNTRSAARWRRKSPSATAPRTSPSSGSRTSEAHRRRTRTAQASLASPLITRGTRRRSAVEGARFSASAMGISRTSRPMRWARITNSLAKRSRSTTQARATSTNRSRRNALRPCVSVPRNQVGALLEQGKGTLVELRVAEIDLVADHDPAARFQDAPLERAAVVRLLFVQPAHARDSLRKLLQDPQRPVPRPVLGQDQLVSPPQLIELPAQLHRRFTDDARLVVDGDDDRDHARVRAASRPERSASSIELYSHLPYRPASCTPCRSKWRCTVARASACSWSKRT